jgi:hypothetical protein
MRYGVCSDVYILDNEMSTNEITGDKIATKLGSDEARRNFDDGFDLIFGKKEPKEADKPASSLMEADNVPNSE